MQDVFGDAVWRSLTAPRQAARALLAMRLGWAEVGLIIAAGITVDVLLTRVLTLTLAPEVAAQPVVVLQGLSVIGIAMRIFAVFLGCALCLGVARLFGLRADLLRVATAIAWVNLVSALLGTVQVIGIVLFAPLMTIVQTGLLVLGLWVFASFIAEVFGVASTGRVVAATVATTVALALILAVLAVLLGLAPGV